MTIKILIVDDSLTEYNLLKTIFEHEPDMKVIGHARNGQEALKQTELLKPDLITMDILMPLMDGFEATRAIMSHHPTPIVVISSAIFDESLKIAFKALEAGALSVIEKPTHLHLNQKYKRMIDTLRAMAEIKVIKRRFHIKHQSHVLNITNSDKHREFEIIAIGTSVGGPQALKIILSNLPADFPVPIVIVQHMTPGFIEGFAKWLNDNTLLKVKNAVDNEVLLGHTVYFAPDNYHLEVQREKNTHLLRAKLSKRPPVSGFCPSATVLLESVAEVCGSHAIGVLLTGMGNDGAQGLLALRHQKGHTIIQDQESAIVFGMPGVAQSLGAAEKIVKLDSIAEYLTKAVKEKIIIN
ncbi:MAG: chemotaxis-specific protein-glutamate methyltransferase CheB [Gammaproteobacteria bacterium]|nr:chemotaxis-specific protein-glutamate methyltransferase CheB [Gammaproteobacteria bacterium]